MMSTLLKGTLMLLGAVATLLLAGGFPPAGAPAVYHGGAMLLAGLGVAALCLWGTWRLAKGQWARLVIGLTSAFLAAAGVMGAWSFGGEAWRLASYGGAMWFGAVGVGCLAAIGALFGGIFGFLAWRAMPRVLWLAALHLCTALVLAGAWVDMLYSETRPLSATVCDGAHTPQPLAIKNGSVEPGITHFEVERYEGGETYSLLRHEGGRWAPEGAPTRQGDVITYGRESWPVGSLKRVPRMPAPFLLIPGEPPRLLLQNEAPVKDYRATCSFTIRRGDREPEQREAALRVNEPVECEGWRFYLMNYRQLSPERMQVELLARRAPGRFLTLMGFIGIALCTACWCLKPGGKGGAA